LGLFGAIGFRSILGLPGVRPAPAGDPEPKAENPCFTSLMSKFPGSLFFHFAARY